MSHMIQRAAGVALLAAGAMACAGCASSGAPADEHVVAAASAGQGTVLPAGWRVAAVVTPAPTLTPPIIVIIPTASVTVPAMPPTRAPEPTRTPALPLPTAQPPPARQPATAVGAQGGSAPSARSAAPTAAAPAAAARPTHTPAPPRSSPSPAPPSATPPPTPDTRLLAQLQRGGLVVYLRHGRTDWNQNERELAWVPEMLQDRSLLGQCERQRLLNDAGREDARTVGAAVSRHGIGVGQVLSSQWCRTRETAELAFGRVDARGDLLFDTGYLAPGSAERSAYAEALRRLLSEPVGEGTNRILVGHGPQIDDAARVVLQEGEAVIVRPEGSTFTVLRKVAASGWDGLGN